MIPGLTTYTNDPVFRRPAGGEEGGTSPAGSRESALGVCSAVGRASQRDGLDNLRSDGGVDGIELCQVGVVDELLPAPRCTTGELTEEQCCLCRVGVVEELPRGTVEAALKGGEVGVQGSFLNSRLIRDQPDCVVVRDVHGRPVRSGVSFDSGENPSLLPGVPKDRLSTPASFGQTADWILRNCRD